MVCMKDKETGGGIGELPKVEGRGEMALCTGSCLPLTGFCALFRNPFVFDIKSFALALIPSVRYDPNLI